MTPTTERIVQGALQLKGRVGFVLSENPAQGDVLIEGPSLRLAMEGDRVEAEVLSVAPTGRRSGRIVKVIAHARNEVVGAFARLKGEPVLWLENNAQPIVLERAENLHPGEGELAVARITQWPTPDQAARARLIEVLGPRSEPGVELKALIRRHGLPGEFPPEVEKEAAAYGDDVPEGAYAGRETLFHEAAFTIDGADAKDFDDAVSLHYWPNGAPDNKNTVWRLGVHIADVAQYVKENTPLDIEAAKRGTSVYLSGTVIPMLPFALSDGLCSLRPDRVRLTLSCVMDIDAHGAVISDRVFESAIRSARRFTYEQVESVLRNDPDGGIAPDLQRKLLEMETLARLLRQKRFARGSLDFDFPEPYVQTDPQGRPLDIRKRERLEAHRLIEDFMLAANETVARRFQKDPFLFRIHERPDPVKLEKLQQSLNAVGIAIPRGFDSGEPAALQRVLKLAEGKPTQAMVHTSVLRSLKQAVYSDANRGHYGLASTCYTHFTSPIRRYPDLIVHRIIKDHLHHRYQKARWKQALPQIALHSSQRERQAVTAEREVLDLQRVQFMERFVGKTFEGVITGVTNFGFFVQLDQYFVEGLVRVSNLQGDYFIYDEVRMTLRGKRSGRQFAMGQRVSVLLAAANVAKRQLDFELVGGGTKPKPARPAAEHPDQRNARHAPAKKSRTFRRKRRR